MLERQYNALDNEIIDGMRAAVILIVQQRQHGYARLQAISGDRATVPNVLETNKKLQTEQHTYHRQSL